MIEIFLYTMNMIKFLDWRKTICIYMQSIEREDHLKQALPICSKSQFVAFTMLLWLELQ